MLEQNEEYVRVVSARSGNNGGNKIKLASWKWETEGGGERERDKGAR